MGSKNNEVIYRLAKEQDLSNLAKIYCTLYINSALSEDWNQDTAQKLLQFFYDSNPDIFVVAEVDGQAIGAIASLVKPWHDGNRLIETEVFVDIPYQQRGIGSRLYLEHFMLAMKNYDARVIEAYTYEESDGYPLKWYRKQGWEVVGDWFVINGNIKKVSQYLARLAK